MGEIGAALEEGKDNCDGFYKTDTNLLNKKKKKAQYISTLFTFYKNQ